MTKIKIVNSLISSGDYYEFIQRIINLSKNNSSSYVCVSNVHMLVEAYNDIEFNKIVNNADIVTPDGMPIAKSMSLIYKIKQDRVAGMDLLPDLIQKSAENNLSIFLYGSTNEVLFQVKSQALADFPNLKIKSYSPPFEALDDIKKEGVIACINDSSPDFVFVALGCPKQEKWMAEHKGKINSCMIGLGGALEVYAGVKDRAPKWMQKNSLEWLYRLIQDPRRLWKRYLYTNSLFIILFIKQYLLQKLFKKSLIDTDN